LISSLFMLGSCLGGVFSERLLVRPAKEPPYLLAACLLAHLIVVSLIPLVPENAARSVYAVLFTACGFFVGIYFPMAACRLRVAGRSPAASGSNLEMLDHVGGAAGALLTGCMLLPVLGGELALAVLALLVAVNLAPALVRARPIVVSHEADAFDRLARPVGYTAFGIGAFLLISSLLVSVVQTGKEERLLFAAAREMIREVELTEQRAQLDDGSVIAYLTASDGSLVFSTGPFAEGVQGYGGPIVLAAYVERQGTLVDFRIIRSNETPAYVDSLRRDWLTGLPGSNVFEPSPFDHVDALSGATMTSEAILRTLEQSGRGFAAAVLGMQTEGPPRAPTSWLPSKEFVCLAVLMVLALAVRQRPGTWRRRTFLLGSLLLTGVLLNLQYSTQHVMALLSLRLSGAWLSGSFFLVLLIPLCVLLFGNVYCGYVCPFGALQELVGELRPARLVSDPDKRVWRYARAVKYALLLLLAVLFALTRDYAVLSADPLTTIFSTLRDWPILSTAVVILALSMVFRRFWCRNLCPAGAFLALLCGAKLFKTLSPPTAPRRCDLGVRVSSELDCLCCDRCRCEEN
jgi:Na+-translocating ferredoxin:NAD+ oxidoreductase RnfG subunit